MDIDDSQLNYYLEQLNLLLPSMHLQWLNTNATVALIDVNPVMGTYHVLAQTRMREQMVENAAALVRVLKRAHASRFKKISRKARAREGREMMWATIKSLDAFTLQLYVYT